MEYKDGKRKKDKYNENDESVDNSKGSRSKRRRSRSRTPKENRNVNSRYKRKHSKSPERNDAKHEKRSNDLPKDDESKRHAPVRKAKETDMLNTRTGGAYIPPARLRMMQAQITDKSSVAYQRLAWEALKKSIHGHINKINVGNIGIIIKELLKENIVRGRGLLCRSVIQAQAASPTFTNVYAALVSAVNSRFPNIGELLLKRLVIQFKRGFKRNDKPICISSASFIAHLVNQKVAHEILALELLTLLVETPTDDSVEVAIAFLKECGQKLTEVSSKGVNAIFEMLRNILHEGQLDKRVQYMIEVMFQVWKDGFKDHPAVIEELELVPEEEQFTHLLMLDDATDSQDILNVFKFDDKYEENEQKYKTLSKEILGSDAESGEEDGSEGSGSEESDEEEDESEKKEMTIIDKTETNLVALRRTIYLTINSSLDFEECAHKLMKMQLKPGQEIELCHMFLDCCAEQRTYEKFYGLLAQRFCNINRIYIGPFEEIFKDSYATAHRLDTNRLRNVSKFFAHLLFTDSISWEVLECVKLNEEDTTSSSRIYIKILFQELAEYMGLKKLNDRLKDPTLQQAFSGVFPRDNPKNTRFSINFFTSIGLGGLTDELREHLKQMPKNVPPPVTEINIDSESSSDSSSSSSSSSSSDSSSSESSDDEEQSKKKSKSKKAKKDKSKKEQTQEIEGANQTNVSPKRWGHDGFYNTYGQGARRDDQNRSGGNQRPGDRDNETSRYQKQQHTNGEYRGRNGSREREIGERYHSNSKREDYGRRGRAEDERRQINSKDDERGHKRDEDERKRRDSNEDERGHKRDDKERRRRGGNDDERYHKKDEDEERRRVVNDDKRRRRGSNDDDRRRRGGNDDERGRRKDKDDEMRRRKDDDDGRGCRREDEVKHKKGDKEESKKKVEGEHEKRRGADVSDDEYRRRKDHGNDRRRRREDENAEKDRGVERESRRRNENENKKRNDNDELNRNKYVMKQTGESDDRRKSGESYRRRDYDNERRDRQDNVRESERKKEEKDEGKRNRYIDGDDRQRNDQNVTKRSKDGDSERQRKDYREDKEDNRQRQNKEDRKRVDDSETDRRKNYDEDRTRKRTKDDKLEHKRGIENDRNRRDDILNAEKTDNKKDHARKHESGSDDERKKDVRSKNKNKRDEQSKESKNEKSNMEERKTKKKERKRNETSSESDSTSDSDSESDSSTDSSDSDSESDTGISKPRKNKSPRKKSNKDDSDKEKNNCGGRYWDRFDINTRDRKAVK